jgi:N-acetyl-anhydromuramyl-L-alanine amidase AmpD
MVRLVLPAMLSVMLSILLLAQAGGRIHPVVIPAHRVVSTRPQPSPQVGDVWLVEKTGIVELYSNGLQIDNRFLVANRPRSYVAFPLHPGYSSAPAPSAPAGIVFHATQSRQVPFEPNQNGALKKIGESLLEYVQRKRAYHFLIDRFGRVHRVVAETDSANHAGYSIWADDQWLYINLNQSFLGIAIEAESLPGQGDPFMSPAQLRSVGMLTELLRSRYKIPAENCVTHAQVSVNPSNLQVGYHTDWASGFPFAQLTLPNNYARPLPAIRTFGFEYSPEFAGWAGESLKVGLETAGAELAEAAADARMSLHSYRKSLQNQYRQLLAEVRRANSTQSEADCTESDRAE